MQLVRMNEIRKGFGSRMARQKREANIFYGEEESSGSENVKKSDGSPRVFLKSERSRS